LVSDSVDGDGAYTIIYNAPPSMPVISVPATVAAGQTVNISWSSSTDPEGTTVGYKLERKVNGGSYTQIYAGSALSYSDTINVAWSTVQWRVKAYDEGSIESSYSESAEKSVADNTAPSVPGNFTYPSSIHGGDGITLSWNASTDPEGNAVTYKAERNIDGAGFVQVYSGTAVTTTDTVPANTDTVQYRVKAVDSVNAESGYATGNLVTVINNKAPTVPASITVPATVYAGVPFTVSWGSSTDPEGDTVTYYLERQINGEAWTSVYNSSTVLSTSQTPGSDWTSVLYRVKASDGSLESAYKTQDTASTVIADNPPSVSGNDGDLGELDNWPGYDYSVGDPDGDTLTVTEKISGSLIRSFEVASDHFTDTQSFSMTAEKWNQLSYGSYNITVEVADGRGGTAVRTMTFYKNRAWNTIDLSLSEFKRPTVAPMPYGPDDTMGAPIIGRPFTTEPHKGIPTPNMDYNSILPWLRERPVKIYGDTRVLTPETNFGLMAMNHNVSVLIQPPYFTGQRFKVTAGWEDTGGTVTVYLETMQNPDMAHVLSYGAEMEFIASGDDDASRGRPLHWAKYPLE
jgi:hypothetical protein